MFRRSGGLKATAQEVLIVVVGILLAFGFDSWWTQRQELDRERYHLDALRSDFGATRDFLRESLATTTRGKHAARSLIDAYDAGTLGERADSVHHWIFYTINYEVFRPQRGAYDALVNSGEFGLLRDDALRGALAAYFGTFDDARASEQILLEDHREIFHSELFRTVVPLDRVALATMAGEPFPARPEDIVRLEADPHFRAWMTALWKDHLDLEDDYRTLLGGAEEVLSLLGRAD